MLVPLSQAKGFSEAVSLVKMPSGGIINGRLGMERQIPEGTLKPTSVLLRDTFRLYISRAPVLLGISLIPAVLLLLLTGWINLLSHTEWVYSFKFSVVVAIYYLLYFFLWFWLPTALLCALGEDGTVWSAYKKALSLFVPILGVGILMGAIVAGGLLLFIVPGIVFCVWFSLSYPLVVFEGKRGLDALMVSRELVKGRFWPVLWRWLVFWVVLLFVIGLPFRIGCLVWDFVEMAGKKCDFPIWSYFEWWITTPLPVIYGFLLYKDIKRLHPEVVSQTTGKSWNIYTLSGMLGSVVLVLLGAVLLLNIFGGRDIPPVDDSDLRVAELGLPEDQNAYYPFRDALKAMYLPDDKRDLVMDIAMGEDWDPDLVKDLVERNQMVFEHFKKALNYKYFQVPTTDSSHLDTQHEVDFLDRAIMLSALVGVKTHYLFTQGRQKEALDLAVDLLRFGVLVENSPWTEEMGNILPFALMLTLKKRGVLAIKREVPDLTLPINEIKQYIRLLDLGTMRGETVARVVKMGYIGMVRETSDVSTKLFASDEDYQGVCGDLIGVLRGILCDVARLCYFYKPNETRKIFADYVRRFADAVGVKYYSEVKVPTADEVMPKCLPGENLIGRLMVYRRTSRPIVNYILPFSGNFLVVGTQTLLALKCYVMEHGELPESLTSLVPEYLSEVPKDPFDGKPLRYSPDKRVVYSVGMDLKDSGGATTEGPVLDIDDNEPTFKIEF